MATIPAGHIATMTFAPLYRPVSRDTLIFGSLITVLGSALYCVAYNWGQGTHESVLESVGWAVSNLLPWFLAFEIGKRFLDDPERFPAELALRFVVLIALAGLSSILLEWIAGGASFTGPMGELPFALIRRVPAAALVTGLLFARRPLERISAEMEVEIHESASDQLVLPFLPSQIVWIKAAGNYLECRTDGRTALCRMTMKQAEQLLTVEGFVRVHRSALVNGARIAQIRPGKLYDEIQLMDGTWVRVGGAYRLAVSRFREQWESAQGPDRSR